VKSLSRRLLAVTTATVLGAPLLAFTPAQAADPVVVNLIGINDFHGRIDADTLKWAKVVEDLEADGGAANTLMVSAGDNVGASVFASALQKDEPTIDVLNSVGLDVSAVGNHEFDQGYDDLVNRIVPQADFTILGANVRKTNTDRALPAYDIFAVAGAKVAVIGAVTQETPSLVSPDRVSGLTFGDPSDSINEAVAELDKLPADQKPDVTVASFHEGAPDGSQSFAEAMASSAVFNRLVNNTSPEVDAIFMGHTHQKYVYNAPVPGRSGTTRPVVQTGQYGENVGQIKLSVDTATDQVSVVTAQTVARAATGAAVPPTDAAVIAQYPQLQKVKDIRDAAVAHANQVGNVEKGEITDDITRAFVDPAAATLVEDRANESTLGNTVADALLYRIKDTDAGADLGIVNPGGLRADLRYAGVPNDLVNQDGVVTRGELNTVLPFANNLNSVLLTGADIKEVLEQQWQTNPGGPAPSRPYLQLGLSKNVTYTYDATRAANQRILSVRINGEALDLTKKYKVATFSFLAAGGDNFRAFKKGVNTDTALVDRDGWEKFFEDNSPVSPSFVKHAVQTSGVKSQYRVGGTVTYTLSKLNLTSLGSPANKTVSSRLFYGDGHSKTLPSKAVTGGSAELSFTLPAGASGPMRVESTVFPTGTKVVVPLDVTGATATAADASGTFGEDVDVDVTVTGPEETPTGTVTLKDGDDVVGSGTLANGTASISVDTEDLGAGVSNLTISYAGDANYLAQSGTAKVTVAQAGTTTSAERPEPVAISDDVDISTHVESATGTTPSGTVTILDGEDELGSKALDEGGATVTTDVSGLSIGTHELTVAYAGDANHEASTSTVTVKVFKGSTELTATVDPVPYGTSAVVTIQGDPGATGIVYVGHGDDALAVGFLKNGAARITLPKTALEPGEYTLDVAFGGSGTFDAADTTVELTVTKAATTVSKYSVSPTTVVKKKTKPYVTFSVKAAGFTVDGGRFTVTSGTFSRTVTVVDGKARVQLPAFPTSGSKTVKGAFLGNELANPSTGSLTVKVVK
jgi:5'-nucleotidase